MSNSSRMAATAKKPHDNAHELESLAPVLNQAARHLAQEQHPDGYWWYTLEANDTINAEYLLLLHYLGLKERHTEQAICRWLLKNQNADGSWSLFHGGPGDLSTAVECYFALKLCGHNIDSEPMAKARRFILDQGGITKIRIFSRVHLALFGLVPWSGCPQMPVAFMQLPDWAPVNIYEFSSWARASIVPLLVVMDFKKTCPVAIDLNELYAGNPKKAKWSYEKKSGLVSLESAFIHIDKTLKIADRLRLKPMRKKALQKCEMYIREHLGETEDIYPAMFYGILALNALGYGLNDKHLKKALAGLRSFQITTSHNKNLHEVPFLDDSQVQPLKKSITAEETDVNGPTLYQQCCISPLWDTAWAGVALLEAGVPSDHPALIKAARWLISKQITDVRGDWAVKNKNGSAGGWSFEFHNKHYPDLDDTIEILTFLHGVDLPYRELKKPFELGLDWLLSMQSKNGGFAAFDKDNQLEVLNKIPFADHGACLDPATVDITGRMIEFLVKVCDFDKNHPAIRRAADFIVKRQERDGSFWGRWGVNYIYGTWGALVGLCPLARPQDKLAVLRAVKWLKSVQNADGGFGESCLSYDKGRFVPAGESVPSQTAWALMGLIAADEASSPEAHKAAAWLKNAQEKDGSWTEPSHTGTGFPGHFYIRYHGYRQFFPTLALGQYRRALEG